MQPARPRGVPISERLIFGQASATPDWEAIRIFLEVARRGSFRSASDYLGISINALRRRIAELEVQLGVTIFTRHVDGVRTTAEGEEILAAARKMEAASFGLIRARDRSNPALSGEVRLAVTEGLGTFWLVPRLVEFQRAHPNRLKPRRGSHGLRALKLEVADFGDPAINREFDELVRETARRLSRLMRPGDT